MARRGSATPKKKRGRPFKHTTQGLSPFTLRVRKHRQKKTLVELLRTSTTDFFCNTLPEATPTVKLGRPLLPIEKLTRRGAQTRRYRARRCVNMILLGLAAKHIGVTYTEGEREVPDLAAAERIEEEYAEAESIRRERRAARQLQLLAEHNPEGEAGLLHRPQEMLLAVKSGECIACCDETDTFTPCCGVMCARSQPPTWLCGECVARQHAVYARSPVTTQEGRPYVSGHLGARCPYCRSDGVFACGSRALWRAV